MGNKTERIEELEGAIRQHRDANKGIGRVSDTDLWAVLNDGEREPGHPTDQSIIYREEIAVSNALRMNFPEGVEFLHIDTKPGQIDTVSIWYRFPLPRKLPELPSHEVSIYGTGHTIPDGVGQYLGSAVCPTGNPAEPALVWHVFVKAL